VRRVFEEEERWPGICWIDFAPKKDCCFMHANGDLDENDEIEQRHCDYLQRERALALGKIFKEAQDQVWLPFS